jgi:hypothetical protein
MGRGGEERPGGGVVVEEKFNFFSSSFLVSDF